MPEPDPEYERKRRLECLRLASDLMQLAKHDLEPALKAHCLRMANVWAAQAAEDLLPATRPGIFSTH
jgi:hypothetical protein